MKHPPTKPSSAPSLHRYTHTHTFTHTKKPHQWHCLTNAGVCFSLLLWTPTHFCFTVCQTLQDTLAYATALLNEKEQSGSSNGSDGSPANENADRSLRQVALSFTHGSSSTQWASYVTHRVPCQKEQNKNGIFPWLLSKAIKAVCDLPGFLLALASKLLYSSLTPAVLNRLLRQHTSIRIVAQPWFPQRDTEVLCRNSRGLAYWFLFFVLILNVHLVGLPGFRVSHDARRFQERSGRCRPLAPPTSRDPSADEVAQSRAGNWKGCTFASDWSGHVGLQKKKSQSEHLFSGSLRQQRSDE